MPAIVFDATPLTAATDEFGGHAVRGIGRYLASVLRSLAVEQPEFAAHHVRPITTSATDLDWWPGSRLVSRRAAWRPQDIGWWTAPLADAVAGAGAGGIAAWQSTDPSAPLGPPRRGRSIVTAYDLVPLIDQRVMAAIRPHRRLAYRLYLQTLRRADVVIAISESTADAVEQRLGIDAARIRVVRPGLHQPASSPAGGPEEPAHLLFVGVPQPHKNPGAAIAALAECRRRGHDIRLRYVGTMPRAARARLLAEGASRGIAGHIDFLGHVDDAQLAQLYRASVLLALSDVEGIGLTPLEAMLAGGRAICSRAAAFDETLGDAVPRVEPTDAGQVADAYDQLVSRPPARLPGHIAERFSTSASARASRAAYEAVLG